MAGSDLTLQPFLWRVEHLFPDKEIVSFGADGRTRYTYAEMAARTRSLASAIDATGIDKGDRVASVAWNHHRHLELYFGVPNMGAQIHTVNPQLPEKNVEFIIDDADDRLVFVDPSLVETVEAAIGDTPVADAVEQYIVLGESVPDTSLGPVTDYESFLDEFGRDDYEFPRVSEDQAAGMCYTSGTTGKPKGVEYTHKMLWANTMANLTPQAHFSQEGDTVMTVVPMFHVNAWGYPYEVTAAGASHVLPGPSPDTADIVEMIREEDVTHTNGVPTVWLNVLEHLQEHDLDVPSLERIFTGGAAIPRNVVEAFDREFDVTVVQGWGMTEVAGIGATTWATREVQERGRDAVYDKTTTQGLISPGLQFRVVDTETGEEVPWDGESLGELLVKGPWVTTSYFENPAANEHDFDGDWLRTGDVVCVDEDGYIELVDRLDDLIKSGGEWVSTVELENALMTHDGVTEAVVIGVPHDRWDERPLAFVVPSHDSDPGDDLVAELQDLVADAFPAFWAPDNVFVVDRIPQTSTGKFDKRTLRDRYGSQRYLERDDPPDDLVDGGAD
ncbi:long-chain-fatty-acid--CoA ligase [Halobacteriales archaeon Cl-PHB]